MAAGESPADQLVTSDWDQVQAVVARFEEAWQSGRRPALGEYLPAEGVQRLALLVELAHTDLEYRIRAGEPARVESYIEQYPELAGDAEALLQLIRAECDLRRRQEPGLTLDDYWRRFPQLASRLESLGQARSSDPVARHQPTTDHAAGPPRELPRQIGRYRVQGFLGEGGFGLVYLAHDDQLKRQVAIKVPHRRLVSQPADVETYLAEARVLASLDHPNLVPVYDTGTTEDGLFFVVSKLIEGSDLATKIRQARLSHHASAELVAVVADALHYAHRKGLVHRDIKPGNILLDASGKPYVADFGLALREQDFGKRARLVGTPAYMSPEQARGEGHRVDGRSDIFSLSVVFYELLTGRRPFRADTAADLLEQITTVEPRPPRQLDDTIPKELERICLKALAKRASERYTTAKDLAEELREAGVRGQRSEVRGQRSEVRGQSL